MKSQRFNLLSNALCEVITAYHSINSETGFPNICKENKLDVWCQQKRMRVRQEILPIFTRLLPRFVEDRDTPLQQNVND